MSKVTSAIAAALIVGAYVALSTGAEIFPVFFLIILLLFWAVVKPPKKEKKERKITEKDLEDLKEELEEKIKG